MEPCILRIDLTEKTHVIEEIPDRIVKQYLGGRGLGSYLLYKFVPGGADPLGKENHVIFAAGPISGTNFPYSSRVNVTTKSPLTGIYLYSIAGGSLGHHMKRAGFWAIDIRGISDSPVYLVIHNQEVEFKDGAPCWGKETAEAQRIMLDGLSPKKAATVAIGPAGEQLFRYAALFTEGPLYRAFARGGTGCVVGSKNLKGLVVSGDRDVEIADKPQFDRLKKELARRLQEPELQKWAESRRRYETDADLRVMNELGLIPTRNWQTGQFEGWQDIDKSTTPMGWPEKGRACGPYCPTPGTRDAEVQEGPYKGAHSDVEWETVYAFGSTCGINKMEAVLAASQICDEFGIDTMSAGVTIGFAMECFEKGLIDMKDTGGIELRFGNDEAMIAMLHKIVKQEGFGRRLAKGVKRLSEEIKGSESFAMHVKGMELGGYECRGLNGQALQFAISNRGGCHHAYGLPARVETIDGTRLNVEGKGEQIRKAAVARILSDSLPYCTFATPLFPIGTVAETASALFGSPWSKDDATKAGVRVMCQERLFNMREGITRKDDSLPRRLLMEAKPDGPTKGSVVPLTELLDDYYRAMGWDVSNGNPTDAVLKALEIEM